MNTLLQIAELGNFKCLMGDCPDTCCKGWEIPVDNKTFNLWRDSTKTLGFTDKLKIIDNSNSPSPCSAKIKLREDLSCSFLSEDLLCGIHSTLGEDFLSHTCRSYPKEISKFWGMLERSMTLSCPEVARTILGRTERLHLEYVEEDIDPWIFREISEPNCDFPPELIVKLYDVRTLCLFKAQDRNITLEERLAVLSSVAKVATLNSLQLCTLDPNAQENYFKQIRNCFDNPDVVNLEKNPTADSLIKLFKPYVKAGSYFSNIIEVTNTSFGGGFNNSILSEHILFVLLLRSLFPFSSTTPEASLRETINILLLVEILLENQTQINNSIPVGMEDKITLVQKTMRILDHYEDLIGKMAALTA